MNENTEVRDELARLAGWELKPYGNGKIWYPAAWPDCKQAVRSEQDHPIPNTLDEAAKLPEGWVYDYVDFCLGPIVACAKKNGEHVHGEGPTELAARFALRLACTIADDNSTHH